MKDDRMKSWQQDPPRAPKEKATADLLQSLRSTPTLSAEALARIGRRVRAEARAPESRWASVLAGLRIPALAGALGSVAVVGGVTYVALERRPALDLPAAESVSVEPSRPLEIDEPAPTSHLGARPPPPSAAARPTPPEAPAPQGLTKDERVRALDATRLRAQPFPGLGAGSGATKFEEKSSADRQDGLGLGSQRGKALDSNRFLQGSGPPSPARAERRPEASPPESEEMSQRPNRLGSSGLLGAPVPPSAAPAMEAEASGDATEAPMAKARAPAAAVLRDDAALVARAEQLANTGRCADALVPFSIVADSGGSGPLVERALFGRGRCRLTLHQGADARQDLEGYLARFPNGRYAAEARALLQ